MRAISKKNFIINMIYVCSCELLPQVGTIIGLVAKSNIPSSIPYSLRVPHPLALQMNPSTLLCILIDCWPENDAAHFLELRWRSATESPDCTELLNVDHHHHLCLNLLWQQGSGLVALVLDALPRSPLSTWRLN